jgi:hypothetical protein
MGIAEEASQRRHLIALPDMARIIALDNHHRRGGYATIRKVRIEGALRIEAFWEFATKMFNQSRA